jgi:SAM-dependent methyltransferase
MDRGAPIDRYYIEGFLERNRHFIRGTCLEVLNAEYITRFGGNDANRADVLDIDRANTRATLIGDLQKLDSVPDDVYDCFIMTQVLQYIPDLHAAIAETYRILKPGGTVLITVPFLTRLDDNRSANDFWRLTPNSLRMLLQKHFAAEHFEISTMGSVLAGTAFWIGLAQEDLRSRHLDHHDPQYPLVIAARATKPAAGPRAPRDLSA